MNILKLYNNYNIQYTPEGEGHHAGHGWISTNCPWCDDPSDHLGYNLERDYFNCFRCGYHPVWETVAKLLNVSVQEAGAIVRQYGGKGRPARRPSSTAIHSRERKLTPPPYPSGTTALTLRHKAYLDRRGFDPDKLEREWGLMGTGPSAPLDGTDYKYRIIAPIYWDNRLVSFQARDITGRQEPKYLFCPPELEVMGRANLLYGAGVPAGRDFGICVEGVTDVWRFGPIAFATFGTGVTRAQLFLMAALFRKVAIVFDPEPQAQEKARELQAELYFRGVASEVYNLGEDPGAMGQEEADYFVKQITEGGA